MDKTVQGLHHVAVVGRKMASAGRFYQDLLGLSLVKQTVNPDDPYTPLWIFGDRVGSPGTQLHVLFYPRSTRAVRGTGMADSVAWRIPSGSGDFWRKRLGRHQAEAGSYQDPDGCRFRLVETDIPGEWEHDKRSSVPEKYAIRGLDSVRLLVSDEGRRFWGRRALPQVDWVEASSAGALGYGTVHHLAFRTADRHLKHDRHYCRSSYFYAPDGLLCEYATEEPGPTLDEQPPQLGEKLCLPTWYEERREEIESVIRSMK